MITIATAEDHLKKRIGENTNDVINIWGKFKSFAKEDVNDEEERAILFQCGIYNFTGEKLFYYDFVRQFTDEEDGHIQQLHCEFVFEPIKELKKLEASEWYFDTDGEIDDFFNEIETLDEFKIPLNHKPLGLNLYQEEV
ncbi:MULTISPECIES: hypothetical protein [Metabacillus]|jgi:hypothetical protein|uniref:Uncharacterized protein n=1 Tax=Metabacillus rhizolycopersici TaxID=2875709 RepID=A0ABS7UY24_9BACI|nr:MULTISPECIES: hypothetical protein [Metabacillus]MBZ5752952.1 hypothetical protein [Metabacillus rhizolycopersici]MCM3654862.1 hypothetical protein [Metabacillus litoralis]